MLTYHCVSGAGFRNKTVNCDITLTLTYTLDIDAVKANHAYRNIALVINE